MTGGPDILLVRKGSEEYFEKGSGPHDFFNHLMDVYATVELKSPLRYSGKPAQVCSSPWERTHASLRPDGSHLLIN